MPRTAIILGGGGLTGQAFHSGVLAALNDATGFDARSADLIVGTSAGSIVGSSLRFGLQPGDLHAYIAERPLSSEGQELFQRMGVVPDLPQPFPRPRLRPPSPRAIAGAIRNPHRAMLPALLPTGSFDLTPYEEFFRAFTGTRWCTGALWIVGARLPSCERVVFGRDEVEGCDVPRAVSASCAVPGIIAPIVIGDHRYVDGGVHSATNADLAADGGFDHVIVVSPMSSDRRAFRRGPVNPVRMWCRATLAGEVRKLRGSGTEVTVFQPGNTEQRVMGMNIFDEARCPRVADVAYEKTLRRLRVCELDAGSALAA